MNLDDIDPHRPVPKPVDLQPLSVEEIQDYIASLEQEIARASDAIAKKNAHRGGMDALFGAMREPD